MSLRSTTPWTSRARTSAAAGLVAGAVLVAGGAAGAASEEALADQIAWINVGVAGVIVGGATVLLWLLAGRRAVTAARNQVVVVYAATLDPARAGEVVGPPLAERVTVEGSTWYHRPECLLVLGKAMVEVRRTDGLTPCRICGG